MVWLYKRKYMTLTFFRIIYFRCCNIVFLCHCIVRHQRKRSLQKNTPIRRGGCRYRIFCSVDVVHTLVLRYWIFLLKNFVQIFLRVIFLAMRQMSELELRTFSCHSSERIFLRLCTHTHCFIYAFLRHYVSPQRSFDEMQMRFSRISKNFVCIDRLI